MIRELQNSAFMRDKVSFLAGLGRDIADWLTAAGGEGISEEGREEFDQGDVDAMVAGLRRLEGDDNLWIPPSDRWLPHDPDAAILQSSMDDYYRRNNSVRDDDNIFGEALRDDPLVSGNMAKLPFQGRRPTGWFQLNNRDPRWILVLQAKAIKSRRGNASFVNNSERTTSLAENARMVLFGDWASGIPNAVKLSEAVWNSHLRPDLGKKELHVVHLGDGYYAGLTRDYAKRFTPYWPVPYSHERDVSSWCLAGNHDMYSGGHAFFQMLKNDSRFANQNQSSYFLLENDDWQVFGLDTAFDPHDFAGDIGDLYGEQADWVAQKRSAAPHKKCLLMTHHQPFSAYATVSKTLESRLCSILKLRQITAWFWGHEHLCAVYGTHHQVPYPVLLGHGGFPEKPKAKQTDAPQMNFEWQNTDTAGFLTFGFAVLDFNRARIQVRFMDSGGAQHHQFTI